MLCVIYLVFLSDSYNYFNSFVQVISNTDPLDGKDFNPVDYINTLFPTEQVRNSILMVY